MTFGDWQFFFPFPAALVVGLLSLICILNCLFLGLQFDTDVVYHCFLVRCSRENLLTLIFYKTFATAR